jgi:hypothetical protein
MLLEGHLPGSTHLAGVKPTNPMSGPIRPTELFLPAQTLPLNWNKIRNQTQELIVQFDQWSIEALIQIQESRTQKESEEAMQTWQAWYDQSWKVWD